MPVGRAPRIHDPPDDHEETMHLKQIAIRFALAAALATGCVSNRLDGPIYDAEGPPWLAGTQTQSVSAIDVSHRVLLIGDTGYYLEDDPTLAALGRWAADSPGSTVVFLGDNVYNEGLVDDDRERGEAILTQLLESSSARKIFIPGNHDWGFSPKDQNSEAIINQQEFIESWPDGSAEFVPRDGCMGPADLLLHDAGPGQRDVVLVAVDPTPWINPRLREMCPRADASEAHLSRLEASLSAHADDFVVVASHYPMQTGGPHGGLTYGFLGDMLTGVLGWMWGGLMNTYEPNYADWITQTQTVLRKHPPVAYAAGHDHNLQLLEAEDFARLEIVSGAGARDRVSTVTNIPSTIFAHAAEGFVVLDFGVRDGEEVVVARVIEPSSPTPVFEMEVP
jgi:hypothetical protein